jgi:hypothetical protein
MSQGKHVSSSFSQCGEQELKQTGEHMDKNLSQAGFLVAHCSGE